MNYDTDILGVSIEENTHTICGKDIVSNKHELHKFKFNKFKTFPWKFTRYYFKNSFIIKYKYIDSQERIGVLLSKDLYWGSFKAMYNILTSTHKVLKIDSDNLDNIIIK
tara:strand:+ start:378 stop:704 length:327 start_codon:yes stop_codon:yes gene_type:complete